MTNNTTNDITKFALRKKKTKSTFLGPRRFDRKSGVYCDEVGLDKARIFNSVRAAKLADRYQGYVIVPVTVSLAA